MVSKLSEVRAGTRGQVVKNRVHLDVRQADRDQDEEVRRLLDLGARPADVGRTGEESWVCLVVPEGNEFCVLGRALGLTDALA